MQSTQRRVKAPAPRPVMFALAAIVTAGVLVPSADGATDGGAAGQTVRGNGNVDVLYAASLLRLMEQQLGPTFSAATGYQVSGFAAGSTELVNEIKGGVRRGDVFISASPRANAALEGRANGDWVSWYVAFARAPLVLGYSPSGSFASILRREPWYKVVTSPGFRIGRTDPVLDPKGQLTVDAVDRAAKSTHDKVLLQITASSGNVFPEETLLGRLEAGQLDAGFFYRDEAKAAGIPTISLAPVSLAATFTVTVLAHAKHEAGALSFVRFLLGSRGQRAVARAGFELIEPPQLHGRGPAPVAALG